MEQIFPENTSRWNEAGTLGLKFRPVCSSSRDLNVSDVGFLAVNGAHPETDGDEDSSK